jgi:hypothetical protein
MKHAAAAAAWLLALLVSVSVSAAQEPTNADCLTCHGDASLTQDVDGKPVSLHVDPEKFKNSLHGGMFSCVDCHTDVKSSPHENVPAKVSWVTCHSSFLRSYLGNAGNSRMALLSGVFRSRDLSYERAWWDGQMSAEHYRAEHALDPAAMESGSSESEEKTEDRAQVKNPSAADDATPEKNNGS